MLAGQSAKSLRTALYPENSPRSIHVLTSITQRSPSGKNAKFVQVTRDGQFVETGTYDHRNDPDFDGDKHLIICFSSQIGCGQRCPSCASGAPKEISGQSGKIRFIRSLSTREMVDQVINVVELSGADAADSPLILSAMGMGEPFDNWENLLPAIEPLARIWSGRSRLTISTICREKDIQKIDLLADLIAGSHFTMPVKLHFSLHGPDDETRKRLVPRGASVQTVLNTADRFARTSGTKIKLNYVLMAGFNDSPEQADRLAQVISRHPVAELATVKISKVKSVWNIPPSV